jgi:hypothetical protein
LKQTQKLIDLRKILHVLQTLSELTLHASCEELSCFYRSTEVKSFAVGNNHELKTVLAVTEQLLPVDVCKIDDLVDLFLFLTSVRIQLL